MLGDAGALLAASASAQAGITIPAGDWTLDIGGNVNAYYTSTSFSKDPGVRGAYEGFIGGQDGNTSNNITTGLLPNYLSVSGKTRQNDLDVGFTISINPGASTKQGGIQTGDLNQENRQAFFTFGDASWGSVKVGKDLGIYASDAILNDMTLLGVGSGAGMLAGNTTTLGRIGTGFMYADWKSQVAYTTPNWNGFQATVGATQAWNAIDAYEAVDAKDDDNVRGSSATNARRGGNSPAFEAKAQYAWTGDVSGKVWTSAISQQLRGLSYGTTDLGTERAYSWDLGGNVNVGNFGLTGYYYDGKGIGKTIQFNGGIDPSGKRRDSNGYYVQATYVIPTGTKLGLSYGESELEKNSLASETGVANSRGFTKDVKSKMVTVGAYHPLTKHLNLVAEYSEAESESDNSTYAAVGSTRVEGRARTVSLGGILFF